MTIKTVADLWGVLWVLKHPPLKCISPWPIAYVAKLRNKSNVYSLFGDTDLAQQTIPHSSASNFLFLIYARLFYLMHHSV